MFIKKNWYIGNKWDPNVKGGYETCRDGLAAVFCCAKKTGKCMFIKIEMG